MADPLCRVCGVNRVPRQEWPQDVSQPVICSSCLRAGGTQTIAVGADIDAGLEAASKARFWTEAGLLTGNMPVATTSRGTKLIREADVLALLDVAAEAGASVADVRRFLAGMKPS